MSNTSNTKQTLADTALIAGIQKYLSAATLTVLSKPATAAQVVAVVQGRVDTANAVPVAKAAYHQAVVADRAQVAQSDPFVKDVRRAIQAMYSNSPQVLRDFGLVPEKTPRPLTAEEKTLKAAKARATRALRHTMGTTQKAKLTGTLTGPVIVQPDGSSSIAASAPAPPVGATPPVATGSANGSSTPHA